MSTGATSDLNAKSKFEIQPLGDSALIVEFAATSADDALRQIHSAAQIVGQSSFVGLIEAVPGFSSLTVHYDPLQANWPVMRERVADCISKMPAAKFPKGKQVEIPVCYDAEFALDLSLVSQHCRLSLEAIIALHSAAKYTVQLIGFAPGFCYLAGMPKELTTPRLSVPRVRVPGGSIGIGQNQTGIYPIEIPGGWNLIGRTPMRMFRPEDNPPTTLLPGDQVSFKRISKSDFDLWQDSM